MEMDDDNHFCLSGLEEGMLNVLEHDINITAFGRSEPEPILVELQLACGTAPSDRWPDIEIGQSERAACFGGESQRHARVNVMHFSMHCVELQH